jgi:hypothetical protein
MTKTREQLLAELVTFSRNPDDIANELRSFGWESDRVLLVISREHVRSVLNRYLSGELTGEQVLIWAECLEAGEDVGHETAFEKQVDDTIFMLANPDINAGPLTPDLARAYIEYLEGSGDKLDAIVRRRGRGVRRPRGAK